MKCQDEQTEASSVNARRSELLDLPDVYEQVSSSLSKSVEYSNKNVRISTNSNISSGRLLSVYKIKRNIFFDFSFDFSDLIRSNLYTDF